MNVDYVFPHPIGKVDELNVDNNEILNTIESLSKEISEDRASKYWDCKVITSFEDEDTNLKFASKHKDFILEVEQHVNNFMAEVGWYTPHLPNKISQCWFNKYTTENHFQEAHSHGCHEVCAVYYVTNDLTPTQFLNPNHYTVHNSYDACDKSTPVTKTYYQSYAQAGKLVIFPGYMVHNVPYIRKGPQSNFDIETNRITIAMNFSKYEKSILTKLEECDTV
jgi:hypothetical protein